MPQLSFHTPIGDLTVSEDDGALVSVDWGWGRDQTRTVLLDRTRSQLLAYLDGKSLMLDLPLRLAGTPYRQRLWAAMRTIPIGATRTYGQIAATLGGSARSVGMACATNRLPLIIPCHRVVAASGLGGYSGGEGLATKRHLLALEARMVNPGPASHRAA